MPLFLKMEPSAELLTGRRMLEAIEGYQMLEDLQWLPAPAKWQLKFRLTVTLDTKQQLVPSQTDWYALISNEYPWGSVKLFPAKGNGLAYTFEHQNHNNLETEHDWRSGDLCLATSFGAFTLRGFDNEPRKPDQKLAWHIERCIAWLTAASKGELAMPGLTFELPQFPLYKHIKYIYAENAVQYDDWRLNTNSSGVADLIEHPLGKSVFINAFRDFKQNVILSNNWSEAIDHPKVKPVNAIWVRLDFIPALPPWQAPMTYKELYVLAKPHGIDLYKLLCDAYVKATKEKPRTLLLGFPVPEVIGGPPIQIHWQPVRLPFIKLTGGFRAGAPQAAEIARRLFHEQSPLDWLDAQNGDLSTVSSRGKMPLTLRGSKILLVGAGAVGSVLAECLLRGACEYLTILDQDKLEIGNMSRHTLTLQALDQFKSEALSKRLSLIFPGIDVAWSSKNIQDELTFDKDYLQKFDLVIDATGNDEALHYLSDAIGCGKSRFVSLSLGMYAKRLFFYSYMGHENLENEFKDLFRPWLDKELEASDGIIFPREGIGCWHPLFPARADDVYLMSTAAIKLIENYMEGNRSMVFTVLEQRADEHGFQGLVVYN